MNIQDHLTQDQSTLKRKYNEEHDTQDQTPIKRKCEYLDVNIHKNMSDKILFMINYAHAVKE